jgi:hypothetical protein
MRRRTYEAVSDGTDLAESFLLEVLDRYLNDGVDGRRSMWVVAGAALLHPGHQVAAFEKVQWDGVAVEDVRYDSVVTVGGELVGYKLAVLPDANDIGNIEDGYVFVNILALGFGDVCFNVANFDGATGRFPSRERFVSVSETNWE